MSDITGNQGPTTRRDASAVFDNGERAVTRSLEEEMRTRPLSARAVLRDEKDQDEEYYGGYEGRSGDRGKLAKVALGGLAGLLLLFCTVVAGMYLADRMAGPDDPKPTPDPQPAATQEDGVVIGNYTIESTRPISDAYQATGEEREAIIAKLDDTQKETLTMAEEVLGGIITEGMSEAEKEKAIYDWMNANIKPVAADSEEAGEAGAPYGVLKNKQAASPGYATTYRMLSQMAGLNSRVLHDKDKTRAWNMTQIGDDWYHVDVAADATEAKYAHYNINDEIMGLETTWDTDYFPTADTLAQNPIYQNRQSIGEVEQLPAILRKALDKKQPMVAVEFTKDVSQAEQESVQSMVDAVSASLAKGDASMGYPVDVIWPEEGGGKTLVIPLRYSGKQASRAQATVPQDLPERVVEDINWELYLNFGDIDRGITMKQAPASDAPVDAYK